MSFTDAPIPNTDAARFALLLKTLSDKINRLEHKPSGYFVVSVSGTTDSNGFITFTHDAGQVPAIILIQTISVPSPVAWNSSVDNITLETARARFLSHSGGSVTAYVSASITFNALIYLAGGVPDI
jgi:hypothetical protein